MFGFPSSFPRVRILRDVNTAESVFIVIIIFLVQYPVRDCQQLEKAEKLRVEYINFFFRPFTAAIFQFENPITRSLRSVRSLRELVFRYFNSKPLNMLNHSPINQFEYSFGISNNINIKRTPRVFTDNFIS